MAIHFPATARLTVATWIPSWSATSPIGSGLRCSGPRSNHSRWRAITAFTTRSSVDQRCCTASISHWALRSRSERKSRVPRSVFRSFRSFWYCSAIRSGGTVPSASVAA